ncbi:hypothetical protein [Cohnella phaseoli]|uniref:Four helix bundle protein n=1 Tax=Cohnella phaseoli TaxID=456490 RepID=A0A3D9KJV2_9BACL|nr:hypothetical protein [Cohnella phaseoli]RED86204.1 hypothetical protein DFP98_10355 [Cohnella phaseoli]
MVPPGERVSAICDSVAAYAGTYLYRLVKALENGDISAEEFVTQVFASERELAQAVAKLRMIDFRDWKRRREHDDLVRSIGGLLTVIERMYSAIVSGDPEEWRSIKDTIAEVSRPIAYRFGPLCK